MLLRGYRDGKAVPVSVDESGNLRLSTAELDAIRQGNPIPPFQQFSAEQLAEPVQLDPPAPGPAGS